MDLTAPDVHHLKSAVGWLELGNPAESLVELDAIGKALQEHADVLETRWLALAQLQRWEEAVATGQALVAAAPERSVSWLHHAYALRRASNGGLIAAFNALSLVAARFPKEPIIPYNLACYTCQLRHDATETMAWLQKAISAGKRKEIIAMALKDPDLEPLHADIKKLGASTGAGMA